LYRHILKFMSWQNIVRYKKHKVTSHCNDIPKNITTFRKAWLEVSGIYNITFLPFRVFTYYGSSSNLGMRFKYHYFNGAKKRKLFSFKIILKVSVFGWSNFSITIIETCSRAKLTAREDWYLSRYHPFLNVLMSSSNYTLMSTSLSLLTRSKNSARLKGRKE
jgi:group I intron endonuclease